MRLSCNSSQVLEQILRFKEEVERKLTVAVCHFTMSMVQIAAYNTPLGDSKVYESLYEYRYSMFGLSPIEGLARGGWQANTSGNMIFREVYGTNSSELAMSDAFEDISRTFQLGDKVYIGNKGPYIEKLENNFSKQTNGAGIVQPSVEEIQAVFRTDFRAMFERA